MRGEFFKARFVSKEINAQGSCRCRLTVGDFLLCLFRLAEHFADFLLIKEMLLSVVLVVLAVFRVAHSEQVPAVAEHSVVHPVCERRADGADGYVVNHNHYKHENRQRSVTVGDDLVDFVRGREPALIVLMITALDYLSYVDISLVCDDALRVVVKLLLGGSYVLFDMLQNVPGNVELFEYPLVALKNLDGIPPLLLLGKVMNNGFLNVSESVLNRAAECVLRNGLVVFRRFNRLLGSLVDSRALESRDLDHAAAESL